MAQSFADSASPCPTGHRPYPFHGRLSSPQAHPAFQPARQPGKFECAPHVTLAWKRHRSVPEIQAGLGLTKRQVSPGVAW
jgi:hypothetical protein